MAAERRRLAAILAVDVVGYSRLVGADEEATIARLRALFRETLQPAVAARGGRVFKLMGDAVLAEFPCAHDALLCAAAIQAETERRGADEPEEARIRLRAGLHLGDVVVEGGDLLGDGVNIAARLQAEADPGGIVLSGAVAEAVRSRNGIALDDLGERELRNIARPVRMYRVRGGGPARRSADATAPAHTDRPSLVVMPFGRDPADPTGRHVADGVIEGIVHALSGLPDLLVLSLGSSFAYAGMEADVRRVGRELGARYVLRGSARRLAGRLRIYTELVEAESGAVLHADVHEGAAEDLFDLQDRIALDAASILVPQVRDRELSLARRKPPSSLTAYELVLQALDLMHRLDAPSFDRARELLVSAVEADPGFAPARSYLAWWHFWRIAQGLSPDLVAEGAAAERAAAEALGLHRQDGLALAISAVIAAYFRKEFDESGDLLERALSVSPNCALAWAYSAALLCWTGDGDEAVRRAGRALRLAPADPFLFLYQHILAQAHYARGDLTEAVAWARRSASRAPDHLPNLRLLAGSLAGLGCLDEARRTADRILALDPDFRLGGFRERTPLGGGARDLFVERLSLAGLPD